MLMLLSPAKGMDFAPAPSDLPLTKPTLTKDTKELDPVVKKLTRAEIKKLMGISEDLTNLTFERFQAIKTAGRIPGTKQAALAFSGDVYRGLNANTLSENDLAFGQEHLRILSGLYGLLRPLDAIQPYRLEMGSKLKNPRGTNLHQFWGETLSKALDKDVKTHDDSTIISLASPEYARSVDRKTLKAPFLTLTFKEKKDGNVRAIQTYIKQARGMMARWAIENRITASDDLKNFSVSGYKFSKSLSSEKEWIFTRPQPVPLSAKKKKQK